MANKTQKTRTYGRNRPKSSDFFNRKGSERLYEKDGIFFGKLVLFVILGAVWLKFDNPISVGNVIISALPIGLIVALILVLIIEKYQFNRKIWYVTLILMAILTSFTPVGIIV